MTYRPRTRKGLAPSGTPRYYRVLEGMYACGLADIDWMRPIVTDTNRPGSASGWPNGGPEWRGETIDVSDIHLADYEVQRLYGCLLADDEGES